MKLSLLGVSSRKLPLGILASLLLSLPASTSLALAAMDGPLPDNYEETKAMHDFAKELCGKVARGSDGVRHNCEKAAINFMYPAGAREKSLDERLARSPRERSAGRPVPCSPLLMRAYRTELAQSICAQAKTFDWSQPQTRPSLPNDCHQEALVALGISLQPDPCAKATSGPASLKCYQDLLRRERDRADTQGLLVAGVNAVTSAFRSDRRTDGCRVAIDPRLAYIHDLPKNAKGSTDADASASLTSQTSSSGGSTRDERR